MTQMKVVMATSSKTERASSSLGETVYQTQSGSEHASSIEICRDAKAGWPEQLH